jgi:hypothetical protein
MTVRVESYPFASWAEWRRDVYQLLFNDDRFVEGRFLFRGVKDASWHLVSSFDRFGSALPAGDRAPTAKRLLKLFREECDELDAPGPADDNALIAVAQHHGLPTRALDWSESPFVAAYFAFADVDLSADATGHAAIWALDQRDAAWSPETGAEIMRVRRRDNARMLRQRGVFTYLRAPFHTLEDYVEHVTPDGTALWKFTLPRTEAHAAIADLFAMGITSTRLFPDQSGAARAAVLRHTLS